MTSRNEAWKQLEAATTGMTQALGVLGSAHAVDVELLGKATDHLAGLLDLVETLGWKSTWAKDNEKVTDAQAFMESFTATEGNDDGNASKS